MVKGGQSLCACRYITGPSTQEAEHLPEVAGIALLCAAPATGNDALVKRVAKKSFVRAAKLTWCVLSSPEGAQPHPASQKKTFACQQNPFLVTKMNVA